MAGLVVSGCAATDQLAPAAVNASSSTHPRTATLQAHGSVHASTQLGQFTPPNTGTCLVDGNVALNWGSTLAGRGPLGLSTGSLTAAGAGVGRTTSTGALSPTRHTELSTGDYSPRSADWPVSGTVAVTEGKPVTLTFATSGDVLNHRGGIYYTSNVAYDCP